jgi:Na+-driven multidrug efflux pump
MKALNWIAWISISVGTFILLMGIIAGVFLPRPYLGIITNATTFFNVASSFFLLAIALFIFLYRCRCNEK